MTKYHVNGETGRAGICRATKKGCPLGDDTPHFESKEEAKAHIEKTEASNNSAFTTVKKGDAPAKAPRQFATAADLKRKKVEKAISEIQGEIDALNEIKEQARAIGNNELIATANGQIRGKSIHLSKYKRELMKLNERGDGAAKEATIEFKDAQASFKEALDKQLEKDRNELIDFTEQYNVGSPGSYIRDSLKRNERIYKKYPALVEPYVIDPKDSKVIAEPLVKSPSGGYNGGSKFIGGRYRSQLRVKDIAANVRADIKAAVSAGELPEDLGYSVRVSDSGSGVKIVVGEKNGRKIVPPKKDFVERDFDPSRAGTKFDNNDNRQGAQFERWGTEDTKHQFRVETDEARQLRTYLTALGDQYGHQEIDSMSDYFSSYGMSDVHWKNDYN